MAKLTVWLSFLALVASFISLGAGICQHVQLDQQVLDQLKSCSERR